MSVLMLEPKAQASRNRLLGSAEIRRMLTDYVRRRVSDSDVDDVVQTVLVEALSSERVPDERTELRKWLTGVARHKIADLHRRSGREKPSELPEIETSPAPVEEHHLVEWAEREAKKSSKDADATLRWMAREGEGDKLEHIAAEEQLPAATVRQRVSRMRRWMKERWLAEIAAAAAFGVIAFLIYRFVFAPKDPEVVREDRPQPGPTQIQPDNQPDRVIAPSPLERAAELRRQAIPSCGNDPSSCLQKLDEAKRLDPAGDTTPEVEGARKTANDTIQNKVPPTTTASPQSTSSAYPLPESTAPRATAKPQSTSLPPSVKQEGINEGKAKPSPKAPPKTPSKSSKESSFNDATPTGPSSVKPSSVVLGDVPESSLTQSFSQGSKK